MKTSIKSVHAIKGTLLIKIVLACLVLAAFSFATIPAWAGDAEDNANKAFADWKAANDAIEAANKRLKKAQGILNGLLAENFESGKNKKKKKKEKPPADDAALANARAEVAAAQAALAEAEAALFAARVALEKALAELPEDSKLKKELKKQRDDLLEQSRMNTLSPQTQQMVQTTTAGGLQVTTFNTQYGGVVVHLPDDIMAGDTISGTVVTEPKGNTPEEKTKNKTVLEGVVLDLGGTKLPANKPNFTWLPPAPLPSGEPIRYQLRIVEILGRQTLSDATTNSGAVITPYPKVTQPHAVTPDPKITPGFIIPPLGQTGRPIVITGPFDGNSSNTQLGFQPTATEALPIRPLPREVIIAESPRKAIFQSPTNVTGSIEITLNEGGTQTKGTFRNVGVNLTAPKTSLLKGESTELRVEVNGLQGITEPVPLHLVKGGVVTMQGGDVQSMTIKPAEVQSNGTFTTTRTITGVQTGVWNATATVVVFDTCLEDDGDPLRVLLFSVTTGDYIFCPGRGSVAGANPTALSTLNFSGADFTGGVRVSAGDINDSGDNEPGLVIIGPGASVTKTGAITTADFLYGAGGIHVQLDGYNHTGNATVRITRPNQTFTITDRDTRNNTCACK